MHVFSAHFAPCASGGKLQPRSATKDYHARCGLPTVLHAASRSSTDGDSAHSQGAYTCISMYICSASCSNWLASIEVRAQVCCRAARLAACLLALACTGLFTPWPMSVRSRLNINVYVMGLPAQRAAGCWVRATAAPPRPDTEAIPNAARFTEQIIADEKKCALALPAPL